MLKTLLLDLTGLLTENIQLRESTRDARVKVISEEQNLKHNGKTNVIFSNPESFNSPHLIEAQKTL